MPRTFVSRGAKCQTHTCTARRDLAFKLDGRCATVQAAQRHCSSTTPEQHAAERCRSVLTAYAASCIMITMITAASDAVGEARPCVRFDGSATFIRDCAYVKAPPSACVRPVVVRLSPIACVRAASNTGRQNEPRRCWC